MENITAENLISEAYSALVNGDDADPAFDGKTRTFWFVKVHHDGTTSIY